MRKRMIAAAMMLCLGSMTGAVSTFAETTEAAQEETVDFGSLVTRIPAEENEILLYYPTPNKADTLGFITICTAPTILVFGDEAYTEESAVEFAKESGLAAIAAENASSVCFVNPADGNWSDKDASAYGNAAASILSTTHDPVTNGVVTRKDFETQEDVLAIAGNQARIYVYGIGRGADYLASNALKQCFAKMFYGYDVDVTPSACTLVNCQDVSSLVENDIPVVSAMNSEEVNAALEDNCGAVLKQDEVDYTAGYNELMKKYRRQVGRLCPVYDWADEGVEELFCTYEVKTSPDNASEKYAGTETHPINYILYYAKDLDVQNGNVPLVFCFHGGGNSALHEVMMTDWPLIGKENGFMTCSIDSHSPDVTATEIMDLLEVLKSDYSIDETRIYASGFSMGGVKSWDLFEQYPQVFAGLAPMDASQVPGTDTYDNPVENVNTDVLVPIFYVGGEISPLEELPAKSEKCTERVRQVFAINKVAKAYDVEFENAAEWEDPVWGVSGDSEYTVPDDIFTDSDLVVQLYDSEDGNCYTALALATNQAHEIYARNSRAAWDFLKKFSRGEDGTIVINE